MKEHNCGKTQHEAGLVNAYREACRLAGKRLAECDSEAVCMNTKAVFSEETATYSVRYFNQECRVRCEGGAAVFESPAEIDTAEKVLVLHYLIHAGAAPLTGRSISFKEIPGGGAIYYPTFKKRAIDPFVKAFSGNTEGFVAAARSIGGGKETFGDVSVVVPVFPLVPVVYVVWQGDEEIASSGTILFDASVTEFLPVEDIVVAAGCGTYRLISEFKRSEGQKS